MAKLDIVAKIKLEDFLKANLARRPFLPETLLKKELGIGSGQRAKYFNWGRNALYYLFKKLKYQTIAFPAFTCPILTEAAQKAGKKVVLVEADLDTFNLEIDKIPSETECLVAVHTFGNPLDLDLIRKRLKSIFIVEDCAHALYSSIRGDDVGKEGEVVLFSLYKQVPNINGAVLLTSTNYPQVFSRLHPGGDFLRTPREKEGDWQYFKRAVFKLNGPHQFLLDFKRRSYLPSIEPQLLNNYQPSRLVLALFQQGFKRLKKEVARRRQIAKYYYQQAEASPFLIAQKKTPAGQPSYYHFSLRLLPRLASVRDKLVFNLRRKGIFLARLWPEAPITQKRYKQYQSSCPQALLLIRTVVNLPIKSEYKEDDVKQLFEAINQEIKELS